MRASATRTSLLERRVAAVSEGAIRELECAGLHRGVTRGSLSLDPGMSTDLDHLRPCELGNPSGPPSYLDERLEKEENQARRVVERDCAGS